MSLLVDTRPLRDSAAFRRLWWGSGLSAIGSQMTTFAVALQVFTLTHSSLAVGTVGLAAAVPAITAGLFGGPVIDAVDRHRLVLLTSSGLAVVSGLFAVQAYANLEQLWLLYALVALQGLLGAVDGPARRTFLARLLPADRVPAGAALTLFSVHLSVTAGPALAGLLAAGWGLKVCYLLDALSFAAALYSIARLPAMRPQGGAARPGLTAVRDGLRFILGNRILSGALLADVCATTLGMPFALFPAINAARFGGGAQTLGTAAGRGGGWRHHRLDGVRPCRQNPATWPRDAARGCRLGRRPRRFWPGSWTVAGTRDARAGRRGRRHQRDFPYQHGPTEHSGPVSRAYQRDRIRGRRGLPLLGQLPSRRDRITDLAGRQRHRRRTRRHRERRRHRAGGAGLRPLSRRLSFFGDFGETLVQPVTNLVRGVRPATPLGAGDHHPGGHHTDDTRQPDNLPPAHFPKLAQWRRRRSTWPKRWS
ncbi:MFS transporter [Fodinicola feengrottensis]|uniref:MFS transporter n=1 Tax=Fodinicola feengrottensis TaxID=435914 RepID=UPI0013D271E1